MLLSVLKIYLQKDKNIKVAKCWQYSIWQPIIGAYSQ